MDQAIIERIDPAAVQRELTEAIERTESLGLAIVAHLDDAERELEDIRRTGSAKPVPRSSP